MSAAKRRPAGYRGFSVDAEGLCDHVRSIMLSEEPERALHFIAHDLLGDCEGAVKYARAVLDGDKTFENTGPASMVIVDETPERRAAYRKDLDFIYAGRIKINGRWMRPVAEAADNATDRAAAAARMTAPPEPTHVAGNYGKVINEWRRRIAEYHAYDDERVVKTRELEGKRWPEYIIFESCGEAPSWWPKPKDPAEAVADARAKRRIEVRGLERGLVTPLKSAADVYEESFLESEPDDAESIEAGAQVMREQEYAAEDERFEAKCKAIGARVREQAAGNFFELVAGGVTYSIPRAPFECWALKRTQEGDRAPAWECVSPSGMKMPMDDEYHTDWVLGAGISLFGLYEREMQPLRDASYEAASRIQHRDLGFEHMVVLDKGARLGIVGETIAVIPHLGPEYIDALRMEAIVCEEGGAMAHLAVVGLERNTTIMRVPGAVVKYPSGTSLYLNTEKGTVSVRNRAKQKGDES